MKSLIRPRVLKDPTNFKQCDIEAMYKVVLIGDSDVGKTSLLLRFNDNIFSPQPITMGVDFKIKTLKIDSKIIKL